MIECPNCKKSFVADQAESEEVDFGTIWTCPYCKQEFAEDEGRFLTFDMYDKLQERYKVITGLLSQYDQTLRELYAVTDDPMFRARLSGSGIFILMDKAKHELNKGR